MVRVTCVIVLFLATFPLLAISAESENISPLEELIMENDERAYDDELSFDRLTEELKDESMEDDENLLEGKEDAAEMESNDNDEAFSEDPENDIVPDGEEDEDSEDMDENEGITLLIHFGVKAGVGAYSKDDLVGRYGPAAQTLTLFKI
ncbi:acidic leucine-rich nuclear phosphoprotein 32 family member B-like isoform X2 [Montipora foliosa]|uniref:acidic leucine-rich nuclear phosphoprotein 32 family member B-like isoform X2 n=1 Tax=Montipora foliosa TaxID=591990 RepID=UPI0035F13E75